MNNMDTETTVSFEFINLRAPRVAIGHDSQGRLLLIEVPLLLSCMCGVCGVCWNSALPTLKHKQSHTGGRKRRSAYRLEPPRIC